MVSSCHWEIVSMHLTVTGKGMFSECCSTSIHPWTLCAITTRALYILRPKPQGKDDTEHIRRHCSGNAFFFSMQVEILTHV